MRPFYFIVSFWGNEFREHFLRLSAASILAPGNVPSLPNRQGSRFLICTTTDDWEAIQSDPTFRLLASYIEPVFIELRRAAPDFLRPILVEQRRRRGLPPTRDGGFSITPLDVLTDECYAELEQIGREIGNELTIHHHYALRIFFMSNGHKQGACRAVAEGACAVYLCPDLILSDGALLELECLVKQGFKVVLTAGLRFAQDECLRALKAAGFLVSGKPLSIAPRELTALVFKHMHPETICFEFDSPYFCDTATSALWRVPGDDGVLLHNLNFYPLLVNYSGVTHHKAEYFDIGGTIDGKYIALHFDPKCDVTVVSDSDRLMLASFTRRSEYYYPVATNWRKTLPWFGTVYKTALIRKTLYSPMGDPVKRHFYRVPIRLHSRPLTPEWEKVERRASGIVTNALKKPNWLTAGWIRLSWFLSQQSLRSFVWFLVTYPVSKLSPPRRDQIRRLVRAIGLVV